MFVAVKATNDAPTVFARAAHVADEPALADLGSRLGHTVCPLLPLLGKLQASNRDGIISRYLDSILARHSSLGVEVYRAAFLP